ncbi:putative membrane protein [Pseudarthrobacter enclensis]|uniref:Membrane protein n=2 Tax=Pseudarthrobacter enclensis TaxID=993070 RepID=A0ABT9RYT0_9MICC|nr:putative membrane protein [Pseudarthrobacter enclensis]
MDEIFAANKQRIDQMKADWAANKSAKERLVSQAESLASSSDLRAASDRMKSLGDEWKRIGPCEKSDNERLWGRFNAARTRLRERKDQEFNKRKAEWAANRSAKERLVGRMSSLSSSSDYRAAKDEARSLTDQWRAVGPCEKSDQERLWNDFKSAKDRLFEAAKRDGEQRAAERRQRAWERVSRLEEQLRNTEAALYRAQDSYSRALSARSPSMNNPNWMTIVRNQQERQSNARSKIASLEQRKSDLVYKLMDARSKANSL